MEVRGGRSEEEAQEEFCALREDVPGSKRQPDVMAPSAPKETVRSSWMMLFWKIVSLSAEKL